MEIYYELHHSNPDDLSTPFSPLIEKVGTKEKIMSLQSKLDKLDRRLTAVVPSSRQMTWQQMEFWCFVHFTVNTYLGKEWGDGTEPESIFNPTEFDAKQWVDAAKSAGMKGLLLTCKHHDGFCLWPSRYTEHTVANSPFRNGQGDLVKEVAEACRKGGIRFGIYLSPWDKNNENYGKGKPTMIILLDSWKNF